MDIKRLKTEDWERSLNLTDMMNNIVKAAISASNLRKKDSRCQWDFKTQACLDAVGFTFYCSTFLAILEAVEG